MTTATETNGRVEAVARSRLAVAADPEAADGQEQRGDAERAERRRVEQQAGAEAGNRPEDRAAQERDREQGDEHDARRAKRAVLGQHGQLEERGDEQHEGGLEAVHQPPAPAARGTSTITDCSVAKLTNGVSWIVLNVLTSLLLWLATVPI